MRALAACAVRPLIGSHPANKAAHMKEGASILVVEDAVIIAEAMKSVLEDKGYLVFTAHDAEEASKTLNDPCNNVDLIITDLNLGAGPSGWDVACRARSVDATIPVIYLTGAPLDDWLTDAPKSLLMQKPVTAEGVAKAVAMFADRLGENHKSCLSNKVESLHFRVSYLEESNRRLVQAAKEEALRQSSNTIQAQRGGDGIAKLVA